MPITERTGWFVILGAAAALALATVSTSGQETAKAKPVEIREYKGERPAESRVIVVHCVEGWDVKVLWEGVPLAALIDEAGAKPSANTVIFRSVDGYSTSLPLAYIKQKNMLLGFRMNGLTLPEARGFPFEVGAEDKWGYKWARWVAAIELSDNPNFRGYWESRGYNNNGDRSGPMYEKR